MVSITPTNEIYDLRHMYLYKPKCEHTYNKDSLIDIISNHTDFTYFYYMIKIAGLESKLNDLNNWYTIFVPSDNMLKKKGFQLHKVSKLQAIHIILFSILRKKISKEYLLACSENIAFPTLGNQYLQIYNCNKHIILNQCVHIIHYNHPAANGLIHVIDDVLLPNDVI
jgi:uncharacterized surface protein with fasciclin (FAS1) repeats